MNSSNQLKSPRRAGLGTAIATTAFAILALSGLQARTWTSADGSKTFAGDFESYDEATKKVTVTKNGRPMTFALTIISEDDQAWVQEQPSKQDLEAEAAAAAEFGESEAGKALAKTKILQDGSFADFAWETPPKYFILYYSGSW
jgi:hypothetical protein